MERNEKIYLALFIIFMTLMVTCGSNKLHSQSKSPVTALAGIELGSDFITTQSNGMIADIPGLVLTSPDLEGKVDKVLFVPYYDDKPIGLTYKQYNSILDEVWNGFKIRDADIFDNSKVMTIIFWGIDHELVLKLRETKDEYIFLVIELTKL